MKEASIPAMVRAERHRELHDILSKIEDVLYSSNFEVRVSDFTIGHNPFRSPGYEAEIGLTIWHK